MVVPLFYCKVAIRHTMIADTLSWRESSAVWSWKEETYAFVPPTLNRTSRNRLWTTKQNHPTTWCMLYSYRFFSVKLSSFDFFNLSICFNTRCLFFILLRWSFRFLYILQFTLFPLFSYTRLRIFHTRDSSKNRLGTDATFNTSWIHGCLAQYTHIKLWPSSGSVWDEQPHKNTRRDKTNRIRV